MRKGTKNKIIHSILIIIVVIIALLSSLVAAFRDVTLQTMVARSVAGVMSNKLNAEVKIRTFYITYDLGICIEDMVINDLYEYPMFKIGKLYAKVSPTIDFDEIRIKDIYLQDILGSIVQYDGSGKLNAIELIDQLGSDEDKPETEPASDGPNIRLKVDNMRLDNGHVVYWRQYKDKPEKLSMDYAHIDIDSIYGVFSDLEMRHDTVLGKVHTLRGIDRCGLVLNDGHGDVLFCEKSLDVKNLMLQTNESKVDLDLRFEYNNSSAYDEFVDSVWMKADIRESTLNLKDLRYFSWTLDKMPDKFVFTTYFEGKVCDFFVKDFDAYFGEDSHMKADIAFKGLPEFFDAYMDVNIYELNTTYDDLKNFAIPIESKTVPLPEEMAGIGKCVLKCDFEGYYEDFVTQFSLATEMGNLNADIYLNTTDNSEYMFNIDIDSLDLTDALGMDYETSASLAINMDGHGLEVKDTDFSANIDVRSLKIFGNEFNDFDILCDFGDKRLVTEMAVEHPYLGLDLAAAIDFRAKEPNYQIAAKLNDVDLVNLNLLELDSIMVVSSDVNLDFKGNNIDNITGSAEINNTSYFNGSHYNMDKFTASVSDIGGIKDVAINCDFFDFSGSGIIHPNTLIEAIKNTARSYIQLPALYGPEITKTDKQEFSISLNLKDTRQISSLLMPNLYLSEGTSVTATYTTEYPYHGSTIEAPEIVFNDIKIKNLDIRNTAKYNEYVSNIFIEDIILRDTSEQYTNRLSLENVIINSRCADDSLNMKLIWDDDDVEDHNKAHFSFGFVPHPLSGGKLRISSDEFVLNDTLWRVHPDCMIDFQKESISVDNLMLYTYTQSIAVNGNVPQHDSDTLMAVLNNVNLSVFDFLTVENDIDFDGIANGLVSLSGYEDNMTFAGNLEMDSLYLNKQEVGDVYVNTRWNDDDKSIYINAQIFNDMFGKDYHEAVGLKGYYYPTLEDDKLKLDLDFDEFKLGTLSPFISNVVKRMSGTASGNVKIRGSIKEPEILGDVVLKKAGCTVNYLNTHFTFDDTITILKDKIVFKDIAVYDTLGNTARLNGAINHNHFNDFYFDLSIRCSNFLAFNIPMENASGFYGSAVADGVVNLKGPMDDIVMDIDVRTRKGTEIDVPLSSASSIHDDFIVFVDNSKKEDTLVKYVPELMKDDSRYTININAAVNPDAEVNIFLPQNMGSISARGVGNLNLGVTNNEFTMQGDYLIRGGSFDFVIQPIKKTFILRNGGTIRWAGDPTDADINIVGVYRTKSSLSSLGAVASDTTAITNNVNVDCIIRLSDKLMNPTLTFGIELPNVKDDTRTLVYSVIDTTNQAVMAQQVFSLLMLGSFSYAAESNVSRLGTTAGYGVITSQLSSWLSQISKDLDIGINYTPNDRVTNEEIEVALSTQLFDDRLTIEGNFGVIRGNKNTNNANNIVGDVDITFKLTNRLSLKAYNHTNIKNNYFIYSFENHSDFTQGVGISYSQSFDKISEIFKKHRKNKAKR